MNENIINLGTISEDFDNSDCMFTELDIREYLYSTNEYIPCSSSAEITLEDQSINSEDVPDIIEKGDKIITKEIADLIMSFDPYGIEIYPAKLLVEDKVIHNRYIISVKNIIDAADLEKSDIFNNPRPHRPPIVSQLAICPKKLSIIPIHKRLVFRVKESNTIFFDGSIVEKFVEDLITGCFYLCETTPFNTSELAPIR